MEKTLLLKFRHQQDESVESLDGKEDRKHCYESGVALSNGLRIVTGEG